jgi:hypothetical protein
MDGRVDITAIDKSNLGFGIPSINKKYCLFISDLLNYCLLRRLGRLFMLDDEHHSGTVELPVAPLRIL